MAVVLRDVAGQLEVPLLILPDGQFLGASPATSAACSTG